MPEIWFISDTHFGHKNILEYEPDARPFKTIEEMNDALVDSWNSVVGVKDTVYHLGDVAFGRSNIRLVGRCNGRKRLILGNHDCYPNSLYLEYFEKLYGSVFYNRCVLSHIPVHVAGLGARWLLNIHGHLHSRKVKRSIGIVLDVPADNGKMVTISTPITEDYDPNYFNVSCEQNNLKPTNWEVIKERIKKIT